MNSQKIHYAVIALTKKDAKDLIEAKGVIKGDLLNKHECESKIEYKIESEILRYIKDNYDLMYGDSPDDWKPFKGTDKSISEIIMQISSGKFCSDTEYVHSKLLDTNLTQLLPNIEVLFIDIFALYMNKYAQFSIKADYACDRGERHICCFVIDLTSFSSIQSELIENHKAKLWPSVSYCHNEDTTGRCLNSVVYQITQLWNFINKLQPLFKSQGQPTIKNSNQAEITLGPYSKNPTTPPRL